MSVPSLGLALLELAGAVQLVIEAGMPHSPEEWRRFSTALENVRVQLPISSMPGHNKLIARGAEYLGDGVYVEESEGIRLTGNAFSRENTIFLEPREWQALQRWAKEHGYT